MTSGHTVATLALLAFALAGCASTSPEERAAAARVRVVNTVAAGRRRRWRVPILHVHDGRGVPLWKWRAMTWWQKFPRLHPTRPEAELVNALKLQRVLEGSWWNYRVARVLGLSVSTLIAEILAKLSTRRAAE